MQGNGFVALENCINTYLNQFDMGFEAFIDEEAKIIAVVTPFVGPFGSNIQIMVEKHSSDTLRLHDDGDTLKDLQAAKQYQTYRPIIQRILRKFRVKRDKNRLYIDLADTNRFISEFARLLTALILLHNLQVIIK